MAISFVQLADIDKLLHSIAVLSSLQQHSETEQSGLETNILFIDAIV